VQQTVGVNITQYLLDTQPGPAVVLVVLEKRNICPDKCSTLHRKCVLYWECESPGVSAAAGAGCGFNTTIRLTATNTTNTTNEGKRWCNHHHHHQSQGKRGKGQGARPN
jgi:hypothetical protein